MFKENYFTLKDWFLNLHYLDRIFVVIDVLGCLTFPIFFILSPSAANFVISLVFIHFLIEDFNTFSWYKFDQSTIGLYHYRGDNRLHTLADRIMDAGICYEQIANFLMQTYPNYFNSESNSNIQADSYNKSLIISLNSVPDNFKVNEEDIVIEFLVETGFEEVIFKYNDVYQQLLLVSNGFVKSLSEVEEVE